MVAGKKQQFGSSKKVGWKKINLQFPTQSSTTNTHTPHTKPTKKQPSGNRKGLALSVVLKTAVTSDKGPLLRPSIYWMR